MKDFDTFTTVHEILRQENEYSGKHYLINSEAEWERFISVFCETVKVTYSDLTNNNWNHSIRWQKYLLNKMVIDNVNPGILDIPKLIKHSKQESLRMYEACIKYFEMSKYEGKDYLFWYDYIINKYLKGK